MKKTFLPLLVILGGCGLALLIKQGSKKSKKDFGLFCGEKPIFNIELYGESSRKFPRRFLGGK